MSGALLRPPWCRACRHNLLQSLATFSGVQLAPTASPSRISSYSRSSKKSFSLFHPRLSENIPPGTPNHSEAPPAESSNEQKDGNSTASGQHVPWYLQVETPELPQSQRTARQDLPPLPDNPPPILEDILKHVSVDIGLDDLILFDLRKLDPPPALGANLIMIIGTARSVKHLNVSADRFARWLRSTHKLQPVADGLLGRNELKIKLRRKARRAKLASSAGSSIDNHDDGITTGWICVNAGVVEDAQSQKMSEPQKGNFVGFGEVTGGTRIVVQMLTEEKRADVDLEGLWAHAVDRKSRRDNENPESRLDAPQKEVGAAHDIKAVSPSDRDLRATYRLQNKIDQGQRRALHTCRRLQSQNPNVQHDRPDHQYLEHDSEPSTAIPPSPSAQAVSPLFQFLSELPQEEAQKQLGLGPHDRNSTPFLNTFYQTISRNNDDTFAINKLELIRQAVVFQHPKYSKRALFLHLEDAIASGNDITEEKMLQVMDTLLLPPSANPNRAGTISRVPKRDIDLALKVLDYMSLRGANILTGPIFAMFYKAAGFQVRASLEGGSKASDALELVTPVPVNSKDWEDVGALQKKLDKVMAAIDIPFTPDDLLIMLRVRSNRGDFSGFWDLWRRIPLLNIRRTESLYALFFQIHAERGHQLNCQYTLLSWVPMMGREDPPVVLGGDLTRALMACLLVADPSLKDPDSQDPESMLLPLWNLCLENLREEQE